MKIRGNYSNDRAGEFNSSVSTLSRQRQGEYKVKNFEERACDVHARGHQSHSPVIKGCMISKMGQK